MGLSVTSENTYYCFTKRELVGEIALGHTTEKPLQPGNQVTNKDDSDAPMVSSVAESTGVHTCTPSVSPSQL